MKKEMLRLEGEHLRAFFALGGFSILYIMGILRANFYYVDDLNRSLMGDTTWELLGRPLLSLVTMVFNDGMPLMDTSPWIQIASVLILSYCLVLWGRKYLPEARWWQLAGVLSFAYLNLFLLENWSFKYDALGMSLALAVPLLVFAVPEGIALRRLAVISIVGVIAQLSLYQAAIGTYLGLMVLEFIIHMGWGRSLREMSRRLAERAGFMLVGGIIYKLCVARLLIPEGIYSSEHAALANPLTGEGLAVIAGNAAVFAGMLKDYGMTVRWLGILLVLAMLVSIGLQLYQIWQERPDSRGTRLLLSALTVLAPGLLVAASVLALVLLQSPVFRPRVLMSLSVFTLYLGVMVYYLARARRAAYILVALTAMCTLSLSSAYGNLLAAQERMNYTVAGYILRDINALEQKIGRLGCITHVGSTPRSRELLLLRDKRPLFDLLVPTHDWFWQGGSYINHFRLHPLDGSHEHAEEFCRSHEPVAGNEYYLLYVDADRLIVEFRENQ